MTDLRKLAKKVVENHHANPRMDGTDLIEGIERALRRVREETISECAEAVVKVSCYSEPDAFGKIEKLDSVDVRVKILQKVYSL